MDETLSSELTPPVAVPAELVDKDRSLLAAMSGQVSLTVPVDVQPTHHPRPSTASFQIPVWTLRPCQTTSRGNPTLRETSLPTASASPEIRVASAIYAA